MPTTARNVLFQNLARSVGFYFTGTTSSDGNAGGTTVVDTDIQRFTTTALTNKWLLITSGTASGEARRISIISSSTITVTTAYSAQILNAVTFRIVEFDPELLYNALDQAIRTMYPDLFLSVVDETLVVDNLISNFDFETGTFTDWVSIGSPTLTANTSYFVHGAQAANIAGAAAVGIEQNLLTVVNGFGRIDQAAGKALHIRGWLRATDASNVRLRVTFDGTTYTNGPYHSGDDDWEGPTIHVIDVSIPVNATEMTVSIEKSTGVAAQADMVVAWIDRIARYTVPTTFINGPHFVEQQYDLARPNGPYFPIGVNNGPRSGHLLRLRGMGRLTVPSTETGTTEVDDSRGEVIVAKAAVILFDRLPNVEPSNAESHRYMAGVWRQNLADVLGRPGIRMKGLPAQRREGWNVIDQEGGDRQLLLER